jgi:hypothetical protein
MLAHHPALPGGALTLPTTPAAPSRKPELTFSDDQYQSFTYQKWFARHTGLSLDEALTLGLATREDAPRWETIRSPDGRWHLSKARLS